MQKIEIYGLMWRALRAQYSFASSAARMTLWGVPAGLFFFLLPGIVYGGAGIVMLLVGIVVHLVDQVGRPCRWLWARYERRVTGKETRQFLYKELRQSMS